MTTHLIGTRKEWLAARLELLEAEKELTRRSDELARRRAGAAVGPASTRSIDSRPTRGAPCRSCSEDARSSWSIHFMFGPDYTAGCPSCSTIADGFDGFVVHLANHDVSLVAVSRAPTREAAGVQAADGMDVSLGVLARQRFQLRLQRLAFTEEQQREGSIEYNYRREAAMAIDKCRSDKAGGEGPVAEIAAHDRNRRCRRTRAKGRA